MKGIFARFGIPEVVVSDNGPCYSSSEFVEFAKSYDFNHKTSSPHHPSGNGFSEVYVKICKRILTKAKSSKRDALISILEYRNTPLDIGYTPSELLMGRQLRSIAPTSKSNLMPKYIAPEEVKQKLESNKKKGKKRYDKNAKSLPKLSIGDSARMQNANQKWRPVIVTGKHSDRSYNVQTPDGVSYRRNRRHLMKTNEPIVQTPLLDFQNLAECYNNDRHTPSVPPQNHSGMFDKCEISDPPQSPPHPEQSVNKHDSQVYITRFGRNVKPRQILDL